MFDPANLILSALAVLITLSIHEYAHAYAAYKLGDSTAKNLGRLTLNPIKHIDPLGAICMIFLRVGWAKPVPINMRNFKEPRKGFAITALAGPVSNLILAFISAPLFLWLGGLQFEARDFSYNLALNSYIFLSVFHSLNIGLAVFNLLPIPPLDGSRLLGLLLPPKIYYTILQNERKIYYGLLAWLILGDYIASVLRALPIIAMSPMLSFIVGIFSLSNILGSVISFISNIMMAPWQFIFNI